MTGHLDVERLTGLLDGRATERQQRHVASCWRCRCALDRLRDEQEGARALLASLPEPEVPFDLRARLDAALLAQREVDVTAVAAVPAARHPTRALARNVLAVLAVSGAVAGVAVTRSSGGPAVEAGLLPRPASVPLVEQADVTSTGADYGTTRGSVLQALTSLMQRPASPVRSPAAPSPRPSTVPSTVPSTAVQTSDEADPYASLHDPDALAACLAALQESASAQALAVDFARSHGQAVLVAVFPDGPAQVDVVLAGADCRTGSPHRLRDFVLPRPR